MVPTNLAACDLLVLLLLERLTLETRLPPEGVALVVALTDFLVPDEGGEEAEGSLAQQRHVSLPTSTSLVRSPLIEHEPAHVVGSVAERSDGNSGNFTPPKGNPLMPG